MPYESFAPIALTIVIVVLVFSVLLGVLSRYRKCPSDKIMVIYGMIGNNPDGTRRSALCIHGGASYVWPVIQSYQYMDLTPISINVDLMNALSRQNIRIDVPSRFTVGISTEPGIMQNAAERLLGLRMAEIQELAKDIILGQLRLVIATMDIEEINSDRDKFLEAVAGNVETELKKIGLRLINVNVTDISDESGYISALGKEAAAKAINDAKRTVAEADRDGSIGQANAQRDQRIQVSSANSTAVQGENESRAAIADSEATRREREADSQRRATAAEKISVARALQEAYVAEQEAERARAARDQATLEADVLVKAEVEKRQMEIAAEAEAEQMRRLARGEADALFAKMSAEARGAQEIMEKQAEGFARIIAAAGGDTDGAIRMLLTDKIEDLVRVQVEAVKNLKIDRVTVWDSMNGEGGSPTTASFLSGMMKSVPPLQDLMKTAGLDLSTPTSSIQAGENLVVPGSGVRGATGSFLADVAKVIPPLMGLSQMANGSDVHEDDEDEPSQFDGTQVITPPLKK